MSVRHPSAAAQRGPESNQAGSTNNGGNNESDESDRKPYLDRLTMSAHRSAAGQPWEGLLLQPVSIPNLDHIGIRSSLSGLNSNSHDYITGDPLSGDAIRTIILEKKPLQKKKKKSKKGQPRRLAPIDDRPYSSESAGSASANTSGPKKFQNLLSSAYGF